MYYPIIDKLKDVMAEIGQGGGGGQLVIQGTLTSSTEGTWIGTFSDIQTSIDNNIPVYVKMPDSGTTVFLMVTNLFPNTMAMCPYGSEYCILYPNNTIVIETI